MVKVGDKLVVDGEEGVVVHVSPTYPPCDHDWPEQRPEDDCFSGQCTKCGMSFTRYVFTECP